jgi:hypothetical protein
VGGQQEEQQEQEGNFQSSTAIGSSAEAGCMAGRSTIYDTIVSGSRFNYLFPHAHTMSVFRFALAETDSQAVKRVKT